MNEDNSFVSTDKPRKKKRSFWWLWLLLILAAFVGGVVCGLKINTLPLPTEVRDRLYPMLESRIPGSTTPRTPMAAVTPAAAVTPTPEASPEPAPEPTETPAPAETSEPEKEAVIVAEETAAPQETAAPESFTAAETAVFRSTEEPAKKYIGVGSALEIALRHAEVEEADAEINGVYRTKDEDGQAVYEVSFKSGEMSYDYMIDALDGEIAGWKISGFTFSDTAAYAAEFTGEAVPETAVSPGPAADREPISEDSAREIAYKHASVKPAEILNTSIELRQEADGDFYKVEFRTASRRFEYHIDAYTGEVLTNELMK